MVTDASAGVGVDLIVSLKRRGKNEGKIFGVQAVGLPPSSAPYAVQNGASDSTEPYRYLPIPVCVFQFFMKDDRAEWYWVKEPLNGGQLSPSSAAQARPLDNKAIEEIVARTPAWYESRTQFAALAAH